MIVDTFDPLVNTPCHLHKKGKETLHVGSVARKGDIGSMGLTLMDLGHTQITIGPDIVDEHKSTKSYSKLPSKSAHGSQPSPSNDKINRVAKIPPSRGLDDMVSPHKPVPPSGSTYQSPQGPRP